MTPLAYLAPMILEEIALSLFVEHAQIQVLRQKRSSTMKMEDVVFPGGTIGECGHPHGIERVAHPFRPIKTKLEIALKKILATCVMRATAS